MRTVLGRSLENQFIRTWVDLYGAALRKTWGEEPDRFISDFEVGDDMLDAFRSFAADRNVQMGSDLRVEDPDEVFSDAELQEDRALLGTLLKGRLATRLYDRSAWYPVWCRVDHAIVESQKLWNPARELAETYSSSR